MSKTGRNEPCPCGSGKKYKACCGAPALPAAPPSVADTVQLARQCFQRGQFGEARRLAQSILALQPANADALHLCSAVCMELGEAQPAVDYARRAIAAAPMRAELHMCLGSTLALAGDDEAAQQSLRQAVAIKPDFAAGHNRLGAFLQEQGRLEDAVASFQAAAKFAPGFAPFLSNLGIAYTQLRDAEQAVAAFEAAIALDPNFVGALANLGILLKTLGRNDEAIRHFDRVLAIHPAHCQTHIALGNLHRMQGRHAEAISHFERALQAEPGNAEVRFQIDALRQNNVERPPLAYVRNLFDDFAADFDHKLVEVLAYSAPRQLAAAIDSVKGDRREWRALDLGCGTGLLGAELRPLAASLTGIDLAPKMLDKARERAVYDALAEAELVEFLRAAHPGEFDLIGSADVFIYLGNLEPVFIEAGRVLPDGGLFAFSLEANLADAQPYRLNTTGRYAQSRDWIERLAMQTGFTVAHFSDCALRKENEAPVAGYLYVLRKV